MKKIKDCYAKLRCSECHRCYWIPRKLHEVREHDGNVFWCPGCGVKQHFSEAPLLVSQKKQAELKGELESKERTIQTQRRRIERLEKLLRPEGVIRRLWRWLF